MRENVEHVEVVALSTGSHKEVTTEVHRHVVSGKKEKIAGYHVH